MDKVKVGLIGSQFISHLHAEAFARVPNAEVVAVASPTKEHVEAFAAQWRIPRALTDYRDLLNIDEIDLISIGVPNDLHARVAIDAAKAGKHVVCEKPLCLSLEEADAMIAACREAKVKLMYAEELCFAPKYVRARKLVEEGAIGDVFLVKQSEEHYGPHSPWFWDTRRSGGCVLLDMGCHSIAFCRWVLGNKPITQVSATMGTYVHGDKTRGEDHAVCILTFEGGAIGLCENSWAKAGAVEKATSTTGWTFTMFEESWNYGFPQEMQHFTDCVARDEEPMVTGEDGRVVLEAILAAYQSAGTGRAVELPFTPPKVARPI